MGLVFLTPSGDLPAGSDHPDWECILSSRAVGGDTNGIYEQMIEEG